MAYRKGRPLKGEVRPALSSKRINAMVDGEALAKLEAIRAVVPSFNLSALVREAIMNYDPLTDLNAAMPAGYKVVRDEPARPYANGAVRRGTTNANRFSTLLEDRD